MLGLGIGIPLTPVMQGLGGVGASIRPTLDLNLLLALDPRVTFTRASSAWSFDSTGRLVSNAIDTPRFDYDPAQPAGTVGPELVTNGDFSQGTTGWSAIQNGQLDIVNGGLQVTSTAVNYGAAQQSITGLTSGKTYRLTWTGRRGSVSTSAWLITSTGGVITNNAVLNLADTEYSVNVVCYSTQIALTAQANNVIGASVFVDNISIREVTFTPRGLLIEEQRTNLLLHSRDMTQAAWTKTDVTPTRNQVGIDGTANSACLMTEGSAGTAFLRQTSPTYAANSTLSGSFVLKRGNTDWIRLSVKDSPAAADGANAWFNLATGAKGSTAALGAGTLISSTITNIGGGWYRASLTVLPNGTATQVVFDCVSASADSSTTRVSNATYIVDAAQLEVGAFATSIIPTGAATVTRAADSVSMTGANFSSWFNQTAGTFVSEAAQVNPSASANIVSRTDTNIEFLFGGSTIARSKDAVPTTINSNSFTAATSGQAVKMAMGYDATGRAVTGQGLTPVTGTYDLSYTTTPGINIGKNASGTTYINGWIRRISYYPTRLPNATLQALTA